jgi:hypothetical protein
VTIVGAVAGIVVGFAVGILFTEVIFSNNAAGRTSCLSRWRCWERSPARNSAAGSPRAA